MVEESYIEFRYNYNGHEEAMQSALLLSNLLREMVSFTSVPINEGSEMPFPEILIRNPRDETLSRYHYFNLQDSKGINNFKRDCGIVRESSLERKIKRIGGVVVSRVIR